MALKNNFEATSDLHSPFVDEIANPHTGGPSSSKARKILRDGSVRGKALTGKQKRFFGAIAGSPSRKRRQAKERVRASKTQKTVRRFLDERGTKAKVR